MARIWYPDEKNANAGKVNDSTRTILKSKTPSKLETSRDAKLPSLEEKTVKSAPTHTQPKSKPTAADIRRRKSRASLRKAKRGNKLETARGDTPSIGESKIESYKERPETARDTSKLPTIEEKKVSSGPTRTQSSKRPSRLRRIAGKVGGAVKRGLTYAKGAKKRPNVKIA